MSCYVYVLKSLKNERLYIGLSRDPNARLNQHNAGMTKSTKGFRPYKLIYSQLCGARAEARAQEKKLKSGSWREYLKTL